jgi:hypothetical protein
MNRMDWFVGILFSGMLLPLMAVAGSHDTRSPDFNSDQSTLVAIKEALVSEAQATESKVVNTAWLDAQGQLHESLMVRSSMRVRGIQVRTYIDEIQKPRVEIALDDKKGLLPECFIKDDHLKRTVRITPVKIPQSSVTGMDQTLVASASLLSNSLSTYFNESDYWYGKGSLQEAGHYQSIVSGIRPDPVRFELVISVSRGTKPKGHQEERVPGSDPVSAFFQGMPSVHREDWMVMTAQLKKVTTSEVIWSSRSSIRMPVRSVTYTSQPLPEVMVGQLRAELKTWMSTLDQYAMCQPVNFQITKADGRVEIDGGITAGLKTGDRLLVIDGERIPGRVLEPGVLAELTLAQVVQVEDDLAIIQYAAGAELIDATGKVALPF